VDVGPAEIAVILIAAILVFGPDKLPQMAKQAGQFVRGARKMMDNAKADLTSEMGPEFDELRNLDLRDLNPREIVRRNMSGMLDDDEDDDRPTRAGSRAAKPRTGALAPGERPPYDPEST